MSINYQAYINNGDGSGQNYSKNDLQQMLGRDLYAQFFKDGSLNVTAKSSSQKIKQKILMEKPQLADSHKLLLFIQQVDAAINNKKAAASKKAVEKKLVTKRVNDGLDRLLNDLGYEISQGNYNINFDDMTIE